MADKNTTVSFFYGAKDGIQAKLDDGTITPSDFVVTKEDELVFIDKAKEQHTLGSSKTKAPIKVTGTSLGGIADGTTLEAGTSLDDFIKKLLVKRIPASYTKPALNLATTVPVTSQECGTVINPTLTATFTKNDGGNLTSIEIQASYTKPALNLATTVPVTSQECGTVINPTLTATFTKNDGGNLTSIEIQKGTEKVTGVESPLTSEQSVTFADAAVSYKAVAAYEEGPIKKDNLGDQSPAGRIEAGSVTSNTLTFQGKRQTFAGTGAGSLPELNSTNVRKFTARGLSLGKNSKFDVLVDVGQQHIVIAYPATIGDITQIRYEEGNDNNMAANFQKQVVQVEGANAFTPINYNVYTYTMDVPAAAKMTFKITL